MRVILCVIFLSVQCMPVYSLLSMCSVHLVLELKLWIIPPFFPRGCSSVTRFLDSFVDNQLYFGFREYFNTTRADCVWRDVPIHRRLCPKEVMMELFSNGQREMVSLNGDWWITISEFQLIYSLWILWYQLCETIRLTRIFLFEEKLMWRSTRRTKHQQKKTIAVASVHSNSADRVLFWSRKVWNYPMTADAWCSPLTIIAFIRANLAHRLQNLPDFFSQVDTMDRNWLNKSTVWDRAKENVFFIHGYAGGDNAPPKLVLQDAFAKSDRYNTFVLEYGPVSRAPCFVQVVYNVNYVSHCIASYIRAFERSGMPAKSMTCVGHSIGAHVCGRMKRYMRFRFKKIVGTLSSFRFHWICE